MILIKNARILGTEPMKVQDILTGNESILAIGKDIAPHARFTTFDAAGRLLTPGCIDQHVHITGAGGKNGFASMTPELKATELLACGTTTAVGLLGTDGSTRSIQGLFAKVKALEDEGMSAFMYTGYYGLDPVHILDNVQDDMIFIDKVLGCKIAISDARSSYPSDEDLLRLLRQVRVGGMIAGKKGILHIHLGNQKTQMDSLFRLVQEYEFPIENISPTHVGRTAALFDQAIEFARLGGMIDITTGASKYTDPFKSVLYALEKGIPIERMTFSSDGNAGLDITDEHGTLIGYSRAPIDQNLGQVIELIKAGGLAPAEAFKLITSNPVHNLGLRKKGSIAEGMNADFCIFDDQYNLTDVFARGQQMMENGKLIITNHFD